MVLVNRVKDRLALIVGGSLKRSFGMPNMKKNHTIPKSFGFEAATR